MLSADDIRQLHARGVSVEEARRQLELLAEPRHHVRLERACTVGDGIVRLAGEHVPRLHALHAEAAGAGRLVKFVPASGAASRMFKSLVRFHSGDDAGCSWEGVLGRACDGHPAAVELSRFIEGLPLFAFHGELDAHLRARGHDLGALVGSGGYAVVLDALLGTDGLGYASRPKGLLRFHRHPAGGRTALEEHLAEAASYVRDARGICRLHFTVSPEHRRDFERKAAETTIGRDGLRFEIGYSIQKRSTDTLSLDEDGQPLRDAEGRLIFRPGGHGALIENLRDLEADVAFVKNIDNVQPEHLHPVVSHWKRALAGYLLELQREAFRHLEILCDSDDSRENDRTAADAAAFARDSLGVDLATDASVERMRSALVACLNRPLRVCGVVPNTGEPGGGPFWVRGRDGRVSLQIVEASQIDTDDARQREVLAGATHFNPVDLVCAVRDREGRSFDLARHVDHEAVIVTSKSHEGREVRVLERPGLWNGAMAAWNTVFVETPIETFSPVKTVVDLLRDAHQPG